MSSVDTIKATGGSRPSANGSVIQIGPPCEETVASHSSLSKSYKGVPTQAPRRWEGSTKVLGNVGLGLWRVLYYTLLVTGVAAALSVVAVELGIVVMLVVPVVVFGLAAIYPLMLVGWLLRRW